MVRDGASIAWFCLNACREPASLWGDLSKCRLLNCDVTADGNLQGIQPGTKGMKGRGEGLRLESDQSVKPYGGCTEQSISSLSVGILPIIG